MKDAERDKTTRRVRRIRGSGNWGRRCEQWAVPTLPCASLSQITWDDEEKTVMIGALVAEVKVCLLRAPL